MKEKILHLLDLKCKQPVKDFYTVVVYSTEITEFVNYTMLITESSLIFAENSSEGGMDMKTKVELNYDSIKDVAAATNSFFMVRLDLFDAYFKGMSKVMIGINNRKGFIEELSMAFTTYNLIRRLEARKLPVFTDMLEEDVPKNLPKSMFFRMKKFYYFNAEKWQEVPPHQGYTFLLPKLLETMKDQANMFCLKNVNDPTDPDITNFVSFQAMRGIPLWAKGEMGTKSSLEYYAYDILIDWLELKGKAFSVEESTVYQKRFLLTKDESQWQGHYIKARLIENMKPKDEWYYVAVFRRSYIPPLMDAFDDLLMMGQFNPALIEAISPGLKTSVSDEIDKVFLYAIDSLYTVEDQLPVAKAQIEEIVDSQGSLRLIRFGIG